VKNVELKLDARKALIFGLPIVGLLIGMVGYFALVSPQKAKSHRASGQLASLEAQLLAAQKEPPKHASVQAVDLFRLVKAMPDTNDVPGILLNLDRVARASHVTIQTVTPGAQVALPTGYGALPLTVALKGTYPAVSSFLTKLREQVRLGKKTLYVTGRLLVPNQVQMTSEGGNSLIATLSLDAFVYGVAPPPPPATTTDGTTTTGSA
jgi:Tfp pilus assembly protein PilO